MSNYAIVYRRGHALARPSGAVRRSRWVLYEAMGGKAAPCHWCGMSLVWRVGNEQSRLADSLCVDHLDCDTHNDAPENLVPACRQCNANRPHGGRRRQRQCETCGEAFLPRSAKSRFCSRSCSTRSRPQPQTAPHGTRVRYIKRGCRCDLCREAQNAYWREWYHRRRSEVAS